MEKQNTNHKASDKIRLNKYLAECGVCSRRDADHLIDTGVVAVNGRPAQMGSRVDDNDEITVRGKKIGRQNDKKVLAYYKPVGVTCTERDKYASKKITDSLKYPIRLTYAGRLDKDSEGLLLMTNDGDLINAMMRGANGHEKEYVVKVNREITPEFLEKLQNGVFLKDLEVTTRPCKVEYAGKYSFHIILTQGVNRQIRRMCQTFQYEVKSLKRIRVMNIGLEKLKPGEYYEVTGEQKAKLYEAAKVEEKQW
ncbi:MAG: pseudouridine synthase [Lachnospiraceae bacterium]|nr:pseudouridine synthase [Lachnospiraceae bacterium]